MFASFMRQSDMQQMYPRCDKTGENQGDWFYHRHYNAYEPVMYGINKNNRNINTISYFAS